MQEVMIQRDTEVGISIVATIKPDNSSVQVKKVMGDNLLNISFEDSRYIPFTINDYCEVFGEKYKVNQLPVITKVSRFLWKYTLLMQAEVYDLAKAHYLFLGADNELRETEFSLMGTADDFLDLLITNINRISSGWTKGQVIPTNYKNLTFSKDTCYSALSRLADEFETEFAVEGKVIHLTKRSNDTGHTYKHGRNKGLYEITRTNLNDSSLVTRLYAYGSEKNLPESYINTKGKRLRLPGGYDPYLIANLTCEFTDNGDGTDTYEFTFTPPLATDATALQIEFRLAGTLNAWGANTAGTASPRSVTLPHGSYEFRFRTWGPGGIQSVTEVVAIPGTISSPVLVYPPRPFIERNTGIYGVIEHAEIFEDVFPHRTGTVTGVNGIDEFEFTDADIDFDVNDYLLPGMSAKVTFNTGQLAGYTFEVSSFNNSTKKFKILKNADERVLDIPSALLRPAIGDKYVLTDIEMPSSYIEAAEQELLTAATARLIELSEPQLAYTVVLDPAFIRRVNRTINIGDLVWIVDADLDIQRKIRVVSVTRNIVEEYRYQMELADIVSPGTISRIVAAQSSNTRDLQSLSQQVQNNSILNNNVIGTLAFNGMPSTTVTTGFEQVYIETATGKLYRKV